MINLPETQNPEKSENPALSGSEACAFSNTPCSFPPRSDVHLMAPPDTLQREPGLGAGGGDPHRLNPSGSWDGGCEVTSSC